ncbi:hypothetical protein PF005_g28572 [Phytophthora fragariae]|uniref:Uncharacterized protein n=1 Tax=Phytophthora fragariae TaxID=53985 RepID=A0A6A3VIE7_9STRA|nr:hypothetical protein PF011_g26998 [Phytophthora fragariae]KAE9167978.1 hypothetical protein PF005_g28572 [Phytophthora fragariae]
MKSGGTRGDDSTAALITPQLELFAERTVSFDESMNGSDAKDGEMNEDYDDYLEEKAPAPAVVTPETLEDTVISAGCSGGTRSLSRSLTSELDEDALPVSRNLVDELNEVAGLEPVYEDFEDSTDDPKSPVTTAQVTEQTSGNRPPANGDTPAENLVLRRRDDLRVQPKTRVRREAPSAALDECHFAVFNLTMPHQTAMTGLLEMTVSKWVSTCGRFKK